jgi:uncharacterized protein (DUF885 family)
VSAEQTPGQPRRRVDEIAERFVDDYVALDPLAATEMGIGGHERELPDLSPDGYAAREQLTRSAYAAAEEAEPVDERERAARAAFLERLGLTLERYAAHMEQPELSVIASGLHAVRECFDLMDTGSDQGWRDIGSRLAGVPTALEGWRRTIDTEASAGHVAATRQITEVAAQVRSWTGQAGSPNLFLTLVGGAPDHLRDRLVRDAQTATEAFAQTGRWLETELAPRGAGRDAVGRDRYALASRYFLGAEVDLDETYAWGWRELKRLEDQMAEVAGQVVPGGTVADAVAALDADPLRSLPTKEAFRDWMQGVADQAVSDLAETHFDIPQPIRRLECCISPATDGGIYYTGPNEDFSRPGRMWWSVPPDMTRFSTWREVTTVYHEGVPGHHLQVAQTRLRHELLNRWQRDMCWVSGSGEGWALYAERLMDELGYLDDPGNRLGMLDAQGLRATRVVIDIGMHLELPIPGDNPFGFHPGERWTPELGWEFLRQHSRTDEAMLRFEINRYLGWPGQAPSYKVGERLWLRARDDVRARHGDDFDLKAFHRTALDLGSIGLDPLAEALARI